MTREGAARVSRIDAVFVADASGTRLERLGEAGHLRLRVLRGAGCEAVMVNTGGGIVGGDRLSVNVSVSGAGAAVTLSTVAAEKLYRAADAGASVETTLAVGVGATLHWLPRETILFDGTRLRRSLALDLAVGARFVGIETIVFGRTAHGERVATGELRDGWRVRRDGRLVFADESLLATPMDATLARPALGGGASAVSLVLAAADGIEALLDPLRAVLEAFAAGDEAVKGGASLRDGVLTARLLSRSPERLRLCVVEALRVLRPGPLPRTWT